MCVSVPVYEAFLQTGVDEVSHQRAVVSADRLNAFTVHLFISVCTSGEIQACVALLVDQQVWVVHLWKGQNKSLMRGTLKLFYGPNHGFYVLCPFKTQMLK